MKKKNIKTKFGEKVTKDYNYSTLYSNTENDESNERVGLLSKLRLSWQRIIFWITSILVSYPIVKEYFSGITDYLLFSDLVFMFYILFIVFLLIFDIIKRSSASFLFLSFSLLSYFGILAALFCTIDGVYILYFFPALLLIAGYYIIFSMDEFQKIHLKYNINCIMIKILFITTILLQLVSIYLLAQSKPEYEISVVMVIGLCLMGIASLFIKGYKSLKIISLVWYAMSLLFCICYFNYETWKNLYRLVCLFWPLNTIVPVWGIVLSYNEQFNSKE